MPTSISELSRKEMKWEMPDFSLGVSFPSEFINITFTIHKFRTEIEPKKPETLEEEFFNRG